jgi:hypothetical protein
VIIYGRPCRCVGAYAYAGVCINNAHTRGESSGKYSLTRGFSGRVLSMLETQVRTVRGYAATLCLSPACRPRIFTVKVLT